MGKNKKRKFHFNIAKAYKGCDTTLLIVVLVLLTFGIIMCFSASAPSAQVRVGNSYYYVKRQIAWVLIGLVAMSFVVGIDYRLYRKISGKFIAVSIFLTAITLAMPAVNGAKRWLGIGGLGIQPSEMIKISLIIYFADLLAKQEWSQRAKSIKEFGINYFHDFGKYVLVLVMICGILLLQPHLSCTILICGVAAVLFFVGGVKWSYLIASFSVALTGLVAFALKKGYTMERLQSYRDPFKYAQDEGYQIVQSFYAIGSGGLFGLGIGQSRQKFLYIPEPQNDFIFSIICEELGFIGALTVILLFGILIYRGVVISLNCKDRYGSLIAIGITTLITIQVFVNIAVVTGLIPVTGMALPFFSYGGSSLVFMLISMGILLNISKHR